MGVHVQNRKRLAFFLVLSIFYGHRLNAQLKSPAVEWEKTFGGSKMDRAAGICPTVDGGYIMAGYTESNDGDVKNAIGYGDYYLAKMDARGNILWQKCLGGSSKEYPASIAVTKDEGCIVSGYSYSNDKDVHGNHGYGDAWIVKLNKKGDIEWQKCFGGLYDDDMYSIIQTSDGGYVAAGFTDSRDGDVSGNYGKSDVWVIKLDAKGNLQWQKRFAGSDWDVAQSITEARDGGYVVAAYTFSADIDVHNFKGAVDAWILKLSAGGDLEWEKTFGGSGVEYAQAVKESFDGGYIFTGMTTSNDGDVTKNYGDADLWIVKLNKQGELQWNKVYGGTAEDRGGDIIQLADSSFVVAGFSFSNDGDLVRSKGKGSAWIVGVSAVGELGWQKSLTGGDGSLLYSINQTDDNGIIVAGFLSDKPGYTNSVTDGHDFYVAKLLYDEPHFWIPNAFSPNGDGLNDVWGLSFLKSYPQCRVEVFNRWGQAIFSSVGYKQAWDGTCKGEKVPAGIYPYVIVLGLGLKKLSGWVMVVR